jgi:topoisomerase-4 subunit B
MDPRTRTLARIAIPDGEESVEALVETLMGKRPDARFRFIQSNAQFAVADVDV